MYIYIYTFSQKRINYKNIYLRARSWCFKATPRPSYLPIWDQLFWNQNLSGLHCWEFFGGVGAASRTLLMLQKSGEKTTWNVPQTMYITWDMNHIKWLAGVLNHQQYNSSWMLETSDKNAFWKRSRPAFFPLFHLCCHIKKWGIKQPHGFPVTFVCFKDEPHYFFKKYSINTNSPPRSETPQSYPGNKFLSKNALEILEVLHQEGNGKLCVPNQKGPSKTRRQPFSGLPPRKFIICLGVSLFSKFRYSFLGGSFLLGVWPVFFGGYLPAPSQGCQMVPKKYQFSIF